ncbi:MAG TPA: FMN reductase [Jiangellales bacterium]|nr:FMN reductase [Jiangellales bacterium]
MTTRTLAVVSAGLRKPSSTRLLADQLAAGAERAFGQRSIQPVLDVIELREHAQDLANNLLTGFPSAGLRSTVDRVLSADCLIAVTPIFTASYSGLFKMFFDVLEDGSLAGKPVLLGATGGTERHSLAIDHAMRPLFAYLRALVVPTGVYAASSDWGTTEQGQQALAERVERAASELADLVLSAGKAAGRDRFDEPVPFEQLLAGRTGEA